MTETAEQQDPKPVEAAPEAVEAPVEETPEAAAPPAEAPEAQEAAPEAAQAPVEETSAAPPAETPEAPAQETEPVAVEETPEAAPAEAPEEPGGEPEPGEAEAAIEPEAEPPAAEEPVEPGEATQATLEEQFGIEDKPVAEETADERFLSVLEAVIYVTDEPLSPKQIADALGRTVEQVEQGLARLAADYAGPNRGLAIREVAGGFKMSTKPEFHEEIRTFVKKLKPPLKLSLAALETLAVIAYKQPITGPEIMEIRGVQGAGVLKTLLDRKLITTAGRKQVVGRPVLYKTTKDFLVQFGLKDLAELPTLKEFEEWSRLALGADEPEPAEPPPAAAPPAEAAPPSEAAAGEAPPAEAESAPVPTEPEAAAPPPETPQPEPEAAAPPQG